MASKKELTLSNSCDGDKRSTRPTDVPKELVQLYLMFNDFTKHRCRIGQPNNNQINKSIVSVFIKVHPSLLSMFKGAVQMQNEPENAHPPHLPTTRDLWIECGIE